MRSVSDLAQSDDGVWSVGVHPGHADELLEGLDPDYEFVLIKCGDPTLGWHDAQVAIGRGQTRVFRVRNLAFDVLVTPAEAVELGPQLREQHDGSLTCIQFDREPRAEVQLPERGRAAAMRGLGVVVTVTLPHDGEVAVVASADAEALRRFVSRLSTR
jgi:hypothetical protein